MQITSTRIQSTPKSCCNNTAAQTEQIAGPEDSVTFGSSNNSLGGAAFFGIGGAIPLVGFGTNFGIGAQAGVNDHKTASTVAGFGALANLVGTGTTVLGWAFGSGTTMKIGLGLLGGSAMAGAYAGFVAS